MPVLEIHSLRLQAIGLRGCDEMCPNNQYFITLRDFFAIFSEQDNLDYAFYLLLLFFLLSVIQRRWFVAKDLVNLG